MYFIYKITNNIDGMIYIGSTNDVETRWKNHKCCSIDPKDHHYNYPLMKAFRQYGIDNFNFEIIKQVNDYKEAINEEHNYIIEYNCIFPNGYNQTDNTNSPMFDPKIAEKARITKRQKYGKQVCEIDNNNNILQIWNSIAEVAENTGLNRYSISQVCNGLRLTSGGRIFRFLNDKKEIIIPTRKYYQTRKITETSKEVAKLNEQNEIIEIYPTISIAGEKNNCDPSGISKVCSGKRKYCGGFKWKYLNN